MSEIQSQKRSRDDLYDEFLLQEDSIEEPKRQKSSYNHILSILDEDEDAPAEDVSQFMSSLEQEISGGVDYGVGGGEEEGTVESVMRHLLEASDDELGIPTPNTAEDTTEVAMFDGGNSGGDLGLCDGLLWELEDEAANYYTLLQSELFL